MKGIHYVAGVTRIYRQALDCFKRDPDTYHFEPLWLDELKKLPAWISGVISLTSALIGFVLLLRENAQLGATILAILLLAGLFLGFVYGAFSKTPPLVAGGKGLYRFEKYRSWPFVGIGFVVGFTAAILIIQPSRDLVKSAITGKPVSTSVAGFSHSTEPTEVSETTHQAPSETEKEMSACFVQYFSDIPADRIVVLERGFESHTILD